MTSALILLVTVCSTFAQSPLLDEFNPVANGDVYALALQPDGKVLVGGAFTSLGGKARSRIGRLNPDGTLDTDFNPEADWNVELLAVQANGKILVGGGFTTLCGQPRNFIGRLNMDGTLDTTFNPGASSNVFCLALQEDGKILVGGWFTTLCGQPRNYIGRLNADGTLDNEFNPGAGGFVNSLALQADGRILVGGWFASLCGETRNYIGRLNVDGTLDDTFNPGADNMVSSFALQVDGKILVGGSFTTLDGQPRSSIGRIHADGTLDGEFRPEASGGVGSLAVQADGRIIVGGFTWLGGQRCNYMGRLNSDGTVDNGFSSEADNPVRAICVQADGKLLVGGDFTFWGVQSRSRICRLQNLEPAIQSLDYDGSTLTWLRGGSSPEVWRTTFETSTNGNDWNYLGTGSRISGGWQLSSAFFATSNAVRARGYISGAHCSSSAWFMETYYGGPGFTYSPASRTNDVDSTAVLTALAGGSEPLSYQWLKDGSPLVDGGRVVGALTSTLSLQSLRKADEGQYCLVVSNGFGGVTSAVSTLTVRDPVILLQPASQEGQVNQSATFSVAAAGTQPFAYQWWKDGLPFGQAASATLVLTNLQGSHIGNYSVVVTNKYGSVTSALATLTVNLATSEANFNPRANDSVLAIAVQPDGSILLGGDFTAVGGQTRNRIARLNTDGTLDLEFNPGANNSVQAISVQADGKILVGGGFSTLGGQSRGRIARLHKDGTLDSEFNPGGNGQVNSLVFQPDGRLLVGGSFTWLGGQSRSWIGRLHADGTLDGGFLPQANSYVYSLALQTDGKILAGGNFTSFGGQARNRIARLTSDGALDSEFNPGANSPVFSLATQADGKILVGGTFSVLGGQSHKYLGRLNADGTLDSEFNPEANGAVSSIAVQADGKILVGGQFTTLNGLSRNRLARLHVDGTLDTTFYPAAGATVNSLVVQADGRILVGGSFTTLGGLTRNRIARLNEVEPATQTISYDGSTAIWLRGGSSPEIWRTAFEASTNAVDWVALGEGVRTVGGWQLTGIALTPGGTMRVRGFVSGGQYNGSSWFVESVYPRVPPWIISNGSSFGRFTNGFQFNFAGSAGSTVVVEGSTNLQDWSPLQTNMLGTGPLTFRDPRATNTPAGFYRARLVP